MRTAGSSFKKLHALGLAACVAATATIFGCREQPAAPLTQATAPAAVPTPAPAMRTREQARDHLMTLPELKAWSSKIEKTSGGKIRGALVEDHAEPKVINGKRYWQFSFVENSPQAAHRWESFLVAEQDNEILVEDFATDAALTLEQWRNEKRPMER